MNLLHRSLALAAVFVGAATAASGALAAHPDGHVYVNDNTAGQNTVAVFDRYDDGALAPAPGSPYAVGGAGTGAGIGSQGALATTKDGRFLLAVDAGSNQISVLRVAGDGRLAQVGQPVSSNGVEPVSIAVHDNLVYVANAGAAGTNYTGFTLDGAGRLRAIPGSTVALDPASLPGDVFFNDDGTRLVGTLVNTSQIASFVVGRDGLLTAAPGSPYAAQGIGPFGSSFRPGSATQLYVSNAHNGAGLGTVSAYWDGANGALASIGASPYADQQTAPCWVAISPNGRYLFAVNTAQPSISRFAINGDGTLTLLGSTPFASTGAVKPTDATVTPDGRTLLVDEAGVHAIGAFAIDGSGNLTELGSALLPAGATPFGIAAS